MAGRLEIQFGLRYQSAKHAARTNYFRTARGRQSRASSRYTWNRYSRHGARNELVGKFEEIFK